MQPYGQLEVQVEGKLRHAHYHGAYSRLELELAQGQSLALHVPHKDGDDAPLPDIGTRLSCGWARHAMVPLQPDSAIGSTPS